MNRNPGTRRVVKIGGSLFDHATWIADVARWLARQPLATTLLVPGGGRGADAVADEQARYGFSDAEAHWRCIRAMTDNGRSLGERMPEWSPLLRFGGLDDDGAAGRTFVVDAYAFITEIDAELEAGALPESWDVSSDSIAARVAEVSRADELVLLKSTLPNDMQNLGVYVDRYFAEASRNLTSVRFVNLRDPAFPDMRLK